MEHLSHDELRKLKDFLSTHPQLKGDGVISTVSKLLWSPKLDGYTNLTQKSLKEYGNVPIVAMEIYRTPLHSMMMKAVDAISMGKFFELQKRLGFDKFFHLALVCRLSNGKKVIIQKLDVIEVSPSFKTKSTTEVSEVDYDYRGSAEEDHLTINEMFENAREHVPDNLWFGYDALKNNCQYFIRYLLQYSDLYDQKAEDFLFQNIDKLVEELPEYVADSLKFITDGASTFTRLTGKGGQYDLTDLTS